MPASMGELLDTTWQEQIAHLLPTVSGWTGQLSQALSALNGCGIILPLAKVPTEPERVAIQLLSFAFGSLRSSIDLAAGAEAEWVAGRFVLVTLSIRLMVEYAGATALALATAERLRKCAAEEELKQIADRVGRLIHGSRSPVRLPWGGQTNKLAINVQTFVDELERTKPGSREDYAFLCEGSHPCYFQQFYLHSMGANGDNWSNAVFAAYGQELAAKLVQIGSTIVGSLASDANSISDQLSPFLNPHRV